MIVMVVMIVLLVLVMVVMVVMLLSEVRGSAQAEGGSSHWRSSVNGMAESGHWPTLPLSLTTTSISSSGTLLHEV